MTDAILGYTNVTETDYEEWAVGTAFHKGDRCIVLSTHKIYEALADVTGGSSPEIRLIAEMPYPSLSVPPPSHLPGSVALRSASAAT